MKFPILTVLLVFCLSSKAENNTTEVSTGNDENLITNNSKDQSNVSDENNSPGDSSAADSDSADSVSSDQAAILQAFNRMRLEEAGGKRQNQPRDDNNHLELIVPESNTRLLKYAALTDIERVKNNDDDNTNDDDDESDDSRSQIDKDRRLPRIFSNPKFKQIFTRNNGENNKFTDGRSTQSFYPETSISSSEQDQEESPNPPPPLQLSLGGYQRPFQDQLPPRHLPPDSSDSEEKRQVIRQLEDVSNPNKVNDFRRLRPPSQSGFLPSQPNLRYLSNLPDPFSTSQARYGYYAPAANPGTSYRYPELSQSNFQQNQQLSDNAILEYNAALLERLRNNQMGAFSQSAIRDYNSNFNPSRYPVTTNQFAVPATTDLRQAFRTDTTVQRPSAVPSSVYHENSHPTFSGFGGGFAIPPSQMQLLAGNTPRSSYSDQVPLDPSFLYARNSVISDALGNGESNGVGNGYPQSFFTPFAYPPSYSVNRNAPFPNFDPKTSATNREDNQKSIVTLEQNSEPIRPVPVPEPEPKLNTENLYLNYPTKQAGYGTQEQLPSQNGSHKIENKPFGGRQNVQIGNRGLFGQFPANFDRTDSSIGRNQFSYFPANFFVNRSNASSFPSSEENSPKNGTKFFNTEDFYKNLQFPNRFYNPNQQSSDNGNFFRYPENSINSAGVFSENPSFFPGRRDNVPTSSSGNVRPLPQSPYAFFNSYGQRSFDEDQIPNCAKDSNTTVCFEDVDYPRNQIVHSLESEAFQVLRIIPPISPVETPESRDDDEESNQNTNICKSDVRKGRPLRALNTQGKWKIVVNLEDPTGRFNQNVFLENCSNIGQPCSYTDQSISSTCVQKHSLQRLFVWNKEIGLHTDIFKLPVSCSCQIAKTQN